MRTLFCIGLTCLLTAFSARADLINGIYVVVNDSVITFQEVESSIAPLIDLLASQYRGEPQVLQQKVQQTRKEKIDELIERELVLHEFKTGGYQLPESVIDDIVHARIKEQFGDRATLTKTLQARGMTFETYRKQIRDDYIVRAMVQQKISSEKILISPHKVDAYYNEHVDDFKVSDQVKLRMIVLNKSKDNPEGARKFADEIHTKIKEGASFAEMASLYSDSHREQGGERGWIDRTYFKKELSDAAFALKPGQLSDVIDLPEACYLVLVEEVKGAHVKPLAEVRDEVEKILRLKEENRLKDRWIGRLREKSFIRMF